MTILSFGSFEPTDSESYIANAFERLGHQIVRLEENGVDRQRLIAACEQYHPDLLIGAKFRITGADGFDGPSARRVIDAFADCRPFVGQIAVWLFDAMMPEFSTERWQWAEALAPHVDLFACTDGSVAERVPSGYWLPQGSPDDADDTIGWPNEFEGDVLFVGCAYRDRSDLIYALSRHFGGRFRHVPCRLKNEKEIRGAALGPLVRSYRICICPPYPTWRRYWSCRMLYLARYGGLMASPVVEGMDLDGWIPDENYLPLPSDPAEIPASLDDHLSRDPAELEAIRRAGYEHAKVLSYDQRCLELLAALEAKRQPVTAAQNVDADYPA